MFGENWAYGQENIPYVYLVIRVVHLKVPTSWYLDHVTKCEYQITMMYDLSLAVYFSLVHIIIIVIIIIIIIIMLVITFMPDIYNYAVETTHVSTVCNVAAVLYLQFVLHVMLFGMLSVLYFDISTFRSVCAVPSMAVVCSSFISCFPGILLRYCQILKWFQLPLLIPVYYYYYCYYYYY